VVRPVRPPVGSSNSWGVYAVKKTIKVRKNSNYLGTLLG
jgi:maleate cis-trans isomerase